MPHETLPHETLPHETLPHETLFTDAETQTAEARLLAGYRERLMTHPPTPAYEPGHPNCFANVRSAANKDVARFLTVLDALGLTITQKTITQKTITQKTITQKTITQRENE